MQTVLRFVERQSRQPGVAWGGRGRVVARTRCGARFGTSDHLVLVPHSTARRPAFRARIRAPRVEVVTYRLLAAGRHFGAARIGRAEAFVRGAARGQDAEQRDEHPNEVGR